MQDNSSVSEDLSFCGIYCKTCNNYKKNENCQDCKHETELLWDCPIRICAMERGVLHCGQCTEFPCEELNSFYHDGKPSHLQAYKNLLEIIS